MMDESGDDAAATTPPDSPPSPPKHRPSFTMADLNCEEELLEMCKRMVEMGLHVEEEGEAQEPPSVVIPHPKSARLDDDVLDMTRRIYGNPTMGRDGKLRGAPDGSGCTAPECDDGANVFIVAANETHLWFCGRVHAIAFMKVMEFDPRLIALAEARVNWEEGPLELEEEMQTASSSFKRGRKR